MIANQAKGLSARLQKIRNTGAQGTPILMHRAIRIIPLTLPSILSILILPALFDAIIWFKLNGIINLWTYILDFWAQRLGFEKTLAWMELSILGQSFSMVYLSLPIQNVSLYAITLNLLISLLLFFVSCLFSTRFMPLVTLLRVALMIQISACVYCFFNDYTFPYDTKSYLNGVVSLGAYLLFVIPPLLAVIYYVFDFPLAKKLLITALIIIYFIIFIPFLYTLHILILSMFGLLIMPVLYLIFGPLLITFMFISFYSIAMTL